MAVSMSLYCSAGHQNPPGSRFCRLCGEQLNLPVGKGLYPGLLLGDRYLLVRQLGQGGFGRTYLAEDMNRFGELCVLKEFSPQAQGSQGGQKAEELFEREAGVLYKLQHSQIPRFRELFRVDLDGRLRLLLVQDYVEGETYQALLEARMQQGIRFGEAEVMLLLLQLLPVLEYIHAQGAIHRDISPDNIILRSTDHLPVLIDFGGVKQVAATVALQFKRTAAPVTLLGKVGYAPHEQMQTGAVYPHSDLYALAATGIALLTGKEPQELIDERTLTWHWQREVNLSPSLGDVLEKMLSVQPGDRYHSAHEVLQALRSGNYSTRHVTPQSAIRQTQATLAVAPPPAAANSRPVVPFSAAAKLINCAWLRRHIWLACLPFLVGGGWWLAHNWLNRAPTATNPTGSNVKPKPQFSVQEQNRKQQLRDRRQKLEINNGFYVALVNQAFWDKYPQERGRNLKVTAADEALRAQWDKTAAELLDLLQSLSPNSRRRLGSYTPRDRDRWQATVNQLNLSSRALSDLTDAAFLRMFPQQRGKQFIAQPVGQVWYALAADNLRAISTGTAYEKLVFDREADSQQVRGNLKPSEGKAYVAELEQAQLLNIRLQADAKVLLSIYSPTGKIIMEDSSDRTWSGELLEDGFYEFVVVSTTSERIDYQLDIAVENRNE